MKYTSILLLLVLTSGCAVINPGQVGVKRTLGKLSSKVSQPGPVLFNPFISKVVRLNVGTMNLSIKENLPSKEGLTILSESSILYHIKAADVPKIIQETGLTFEDNLILPVFRSAASDVCSRYYAKDMHSAKRHEIEKEIQIRLAEVCDAKGFVIEEVLLKSITLPAGLTESIELQAEQEALRMEFVLDRQKKEVERQIIEAEGAKKTNVIQAEARAESMRIEAEGSAKSIEIKAKANKTANEMLNSSITPNILKLNEIEAFIKLATSPNAKTVITDGKGSVLNVLDE